MPDIRMLMQLYLIANAVSALSVAYVWQQTRGRFGGMTFMLVALVLQVAGAALIVLRGVVADLVSMALANTLILAGFEFGLIGIERFTGKKGRQVHNYILLAVAAALLTYFTAVRPDLASREITMSAAIIVLSGQCSWLLLRKADPGMRRVTRLPGLLFALYTAASLVRIIISLVFPSNSGDSLAGGPLYSAFVSAYALLSCSLAVVFILMINSQLLSEVRTQEERFALAIRYSPYLLVLTDPASGKIIEANQSFLDVTGYNQAEAIGRTVSDMNLWANEDDRRAVLHELQAGRDVRGLECGFKKKSGEVLIGLLSANMATVNGERYQATIIADITERKQIEKELRHSEEQYRLLSEHTTDTVWLMDMNLKPTYQSPSVEKLRGFSHQELMEMPLEQSLTPESLKLASELFLNELPRIVADPDYNQVYILDLEYYCKGGTTTWSENKFSIIRDKNGKPVSILGEGRDITESKRMEAALRESEKQYRFFSEHTTDTIFLLDMDLKITYHSPSGEKLRGFTPQEIMEMPLEQQMTPESLKLVSELFFEEIPRVEADPGYNPVRILDFEYTCKNGTTVWTETKFSIIRDGDGKAVSILGEGRDITDRKKAEKAVQESESKYRLLVENAREAVIIVVDSLVKFANRRTTELSGYTQEELNSMSFIEFVYPNDRQMVAERYLQALSEDVTNPIIFRVAIKSGEIRWAELTIVQIDFEGSPATLNFVTDITDRRRLEEEQQRVAKLESVGVLAGGIAHDFNNILTSILGNISLASTEVSPDSEAHDSLEQAEKASLRAKELTQQLLTFSKGGAPIKKLASLTELLRDTAGFALRGSNVKCQFSIPADLWHAEIDQGQVSQVIHNLVLNGQQDMPAGGTIEITAKNINLSETRRLGRGLPLRKGNYVRIAIADHGSGIPAEHLDRIFEPFFTTKKKGSGLGLATSFSIAHQHGGHLSVESEVGSGSTFYLYLPSSAETATSNEEIKKAIKPVGKARILVMDDEKGVREVASRMLRHIGYEDVVLAQDGAEAIKLYKAAMDSGQPFSAVILDLTIPGGMGGREAIWDLLKMDPGVKAIVSSGYTEKSVMAEYREYGFSGMIAKPYTLDELSKALHDVMV